MTPGSINHPAPSPRAAAPLLAARVAALALAAFALAGCDPRDCALDIAHEDCHPQGSPLAVFPQDDAICRSYALVPSTADYRACREAKRHVRELTERATNFGVLEEPLLPDVRPVYPVR